MPLMVIYLGSLRDTPVEVEVEDLGCGAGQTRCFECDGSGDWTQFHPKPDLFPDGLPCVNCKGTGKILVSI